MYHFFLHSNMIRPRFCTKQQKYQLFVWKKKLPMLCQKSYFSLVPKLDQSCSGLPADGVTSPQPHAC